MNQYEERLRRTNEYLEQSNQGYQQVQEEMKVMKDKTQLDLKNKDVFLSELIKRSNQVKAKVHRVFEGKGSKSQDWLREALNDIELGVAQIYDLQNETDASSAEVRDHVMELYNRTIIGLLKKQ